MTADDRLAFLARRDREMLDRLAAALIADTLQAVRDHRLLPSGRRLGAALRRAPPWR